MSNLKPLMPTTDNKTGEFTDAKLEPLPPIDSSILIMSLHAPIKNSAW